VVSNLRFVKRARDTSRNLWIGANPKGIPSGPGAASFVDLVAHSARGSVSVIVNFSFARQNRRRLFPSG
jgi:hypothetical protein